MGVTTDGAREEAARARMSAAAAEARPLAGDAQGFGFFRRPRAGYAPRTPAAALRAIGTGMLPAEHFIHASASVKPLDEEPFDMDAVERILARPLLTLQTGILLKRVLSKLIGSRDPEVALFGAEGVNALEGRALARIEALKSRLADGEEAVTRRGLAREYNELAELYADAPAVRAFYLREAYANIRAALDGEAGGDGGPAGAAAPKAAADAVRQDGPRADGARQNGARADAVRQDAPANLDPRVLRRSDLVLAVDILVALRMYEQAFGYIARMDDPDDPEALLLTARVAFHCGDYRRVAGCCRRLARMREALGEKERRLVSYWTGRDA